MGQHFGDKSWQGKLIHRVVLLLTSPGAMLLTVLGTGYWFSQVPEYFDKVDSLLAGGAMLLAQSIVREQRAVRNKQ